MGSVAPSVCPAPEYPPLAQPVLQGFFASMGVGEFEVGPGDTGEERRLKEHPLDVGEAAGHRLGDLDPLKVKGSDHHDVAGVLGSKLSRSNRGAPPSVGTEGNRWVPSDLDIELVPDLRARNTSFKAGLVLILTLSEVSRFCRPFAVRRSEHRNRHRRTRPSR